MKNSSNTQGPLYDIWLLVGEQGAGILDPLGTSSWEEAAGVASVYREQAHYTGHPHFQYVVHQRGLPPPVAHPHEDDLPFGDSRLEEGQTPPVSLSPPLLLTLTFTEQEVLGEGDPPGHQGEGSGTQEEEEEGLLAAFLRGKILHSVPQEEEEKEEPDELYRQTWPYRHDFVPPSSYEQEQQDAGGEENDDSLFFF